MATLHFMPDAAAHVRGMDRLDDAALQAGADRVRAALDMVHPGSGAWAGWSAGRAIGRMVLDREYIEPEGTMSFLAGAMICRRAADPRLTGRYAYAEALYATRIIHMMLAGRRRPASLLAGGAPAGDLDVVCVEVLGEKPGRDGDRFTIPVPQYLGAAVGLGRRWKLVNQDVHAGLVHIIGDDLVRLLRDAITSYIRDHIARMRPPPVEVPTDIAEWCSRRAEARAGGDTPPCVERCRGTMDRGENLPHAGRFLTATFFMHAGLDDDSISAMFEGAPDYDPKITKYHVGQIRRRGYSVPGCRWVASNGLCPGCDAAHPTKYRLPGGPGGK